MTRANPGSSEVIQGLRVHAMRHPGVQEGVACEGTSVERRTVKVQGKAFLFLGVADLRLKLGGLLAEATALASKTPDRVKVGAHGRVTVIAGGDGIPPRDLLERWVDESYALATGEAPRTAGREPKR